MPRSRFPIATVALVVLLLSVVVALLGAARALPAAQDDAVTLLVWDQPTGDPGVDAAIGRVYDAFVASHPTIALEREPFGGDEAEPEALRTRLATGTGPDLLSSRAGDDFVRPLASRRYLVALNELPVRYRWNERLYEPARRWVREDGRLFALPVEVEALGLLVNRTPLDAADLDVPRTAEALLAFCRTARERGHVPFAVGPGPTAHADLFAMALNNLYGPRLTGSLLFDGWARWDTTRVAWAIRLVSQEMAQAGCYPTPAEAPDAAAAAGLFAAGRALLLPAASGSAPAVGATIGDRKLGFAPFPAISTGNGRAYPVRIGLVFAMAAKSAHPREAAMLLDFLLSEEATRIWVAEAGIVPPLRVDLDEGSLPPAVDLAVDTLNAAGVRRPGNVLGPSLGSALDPALPDPFRAALLDGLRRVAAGETTPELLADELQRVWLVSVADATTGPEVPPASGR